MFEFKNYKIIEKISQGVYGEVFKAENIIKKELVAIKIEYKNAAITTLKNEAKIYQYLLNVDGFPKLKMFGTNQKQNINYLIIELLGQPISSLNSLKINQIKKIKIIKKIGQQIIQRIQTLHEKQLIHRDIKPSNFLFENSNTNTNTNNTNIFLIDFGFVKRYFNKTHIPEKKITKIIGTPNFISLNVHNLIEPSRRDDLESAIYVILSLLYKLEWFDKDIKDIYELKQNILYNNVPDFIKNMIIYVRNLSFTETPNYNYLIQLLE